MMSSYITYLFEANAILLVLGLCYYFMIRKETDFRFKRLYIVFGTLIALIIPLLHFDNPFQGTSQEAVQSIQALMLPEVLVGSNNPEMAELQSETFNYWTILKYTYWVLVAVLFQWFLFQVMQVTWFLFGKKLSISKVNNYYLVKTHGTLPTFAFFNLLFFDESVPLSKDEEEKVIEHELAHIEQFHSFDIVLLEITKIIFWFNPVTWYFKTAVQEVHEYLADRKVIKNNTEARQYTSLLAKMALSKAHLPIGTHFNKSKTLKRIEMIKRKTSKIKSWKVLSLAPVLSMIVLVFSCNDEVMNDVNSVMETAVQTELPASLNGKLAELKKNDPQGEFIYVEADGNNKDALLRLENVDPKSIAHVETFKEQNKVGAILKINGPFIIEKEGDVYFVVDQPASPADGMQAFYAEMANTIKYPLKARQNGIEGKVYVQFVVDETGNLIEFSVPKGIGYGCDEAAIDAVKATSQPWNPPVKDGKNVKQRIILPVTFKLPEEGNSAELNLGLLYEDSEDKSMEKC